MTSRTKGVLFTSLAVHRFCDCSAAHDQRKLVWVQMFFELNNVVQL